MASFYASVAQLVERRSRKAEVSSVRIRSEAFPRVCAGVPAEVIGSYPIGGFFPYPAGQPFATHAGNLGL